jgi:hypothetical protein
MTLRDRVAAYVLGHPGVVINDEFAAAVGTTRGSLKDALYTLRDRGVVRGEVPNREAGQVGKIAQRWYVVRGLAESASVDSEPAPTAPEDPGMAELAAIDEALGLGGERTRYGGQRVAEIRRLRAAEAWRTAVERELELDAGNCEIDAAVRAIVQLELRAERAEDAAADPPTLDGIPYPAALALLARIAGVISPTSLTEADTFAGLCRGLGYYAQIDRQQREKETT